MGINLKSLLCFVFWINFTSNLQAQVLPSSFGAYNPSRTVANSTIVSSGLVLHLDAGNASSYPGTGTTWADISGKGNHGTLENGPTYSSSNGGSIVFDGVNDYFKTNNNLDISNTDKLTIQIILKTASSRIDMVMEHSENWNQNNAFGIILNYQNTTFQFTDHNQGYNTSGHVVTINDNNWHLLSVTTDRSLNGSDQSLFYIEDNTANKVNIYSNDNSGNFTSHKLYISARAGSLNFFDGTISQVLIYDRVLTVEEIQRNYNAVKVRYGL